MPSSAQRTAGRHDRRPLRWLRILLTLLLLLPLAAGSAVVPFSAPVQSATPASIPAPTSGAVRPTLALSPASGIVGDRITVSGQGVSPYPGVRVAWLGEAATVTSALAQVGAGGAYSATVTVPSDAAPGPARVCATVTGTPDAEYTCADFTVKTPPPGTVRATFPTTASAASRKQAALSAVLTIYTKGGIPVASAPILDDGSVTVPNVPAGSYTAAVVGAVPTLVQNVPVQVGPGQDVTIPLTPVSGCYAASVSAVRLLPSGPPAAEYDFGFYLTGGALQATQRFTPDISLVAQADIQVLDGSAAPSVVWSISTPLDSFTAIANAPLAGYSYQGSGPARFFGAAGLLTMQVDPGGSLIRDGRECRGLQATRTLKTIGNPFEQTAFSDYILLTWNGSDYDFRFGVPDIPSYDLMAMKGIFPEWRVGGTPVLPVTFPDPPPSLPLIGPVENKLGAALLVTGTFHLDGSVDFKAMRVRTQTTLMSIGPMLNEIPLLPEDDAGGSKSAASETAFQPQSLSVFDPEALREISIPLGARTLYSFDEDLPVVSAPLLDFGIVNVSLSVGLGIGGDMILSGSIKPLVPTMDLDLTAAVRPRLSITLLVDAIGGVVSGGIDVDTVARLSVPIRLRASDPRVVYVDDPCLRLNVIARLWIRANLGFASKRWNFDRYTLLDYQKGDCTGSQAEPSASEELSAPRVLAAPAVASGPNGRLLATYVDDSAPGATTPAPKVFVRFRDAGSSDWGTPVALTDGGRMVADPVAAFVGPAGRAIVAWTENAETPAEDSAAGDDLNAHLKHQEMFYAVYDGAAWGAPVALTNDQVPDGRAAIAGDATGATLAWVRMPGGDVAARTDWRIAVANYDLAAGTWSVPDLLNGRGAMPSGNSQISVARAGGKRVLAWMVDTDGEIKTNSDRGIAIADWNGTAWVVTTPSALPAGAEQPSIGLDPTGNEAFLGFLVLGKTLDGQSDAGVGDQGVVWSAHRDTLGAWTAGPVNDAQGKPVRGEQPRLSVRSGEALLLFRLFGKAGTTAEVGQLALTQAIGPGAPPPIFLTDEPRQHWQPALAIEPSTGQAVALNVGRAAISGTLATASATLRPSAAGAHLVAQAASIGGSADPVESLTIAPTADPALDPALAVSQSHAAIGASVTLTATLHNLGRAAATGVAVDFYRGAPGSGVKAGSVPISETLGFNESRSITFTLTAAGGIEPVYAEVVTTGSNTSTTNDRATASIGAIPAPTRVTAAPSRRHDASLALSWQAPPAPGIAGYRILRASSPGGPYELVGEASGTRFDDTLLTTGQTYYYVVQAYDLNGLVSSYSPETPAVLPVVTRTVFVPVTAKAAAGG